MLLINFFKLPFFNLLIFATRSISRHLASSETLLHAIIDLFSKTRTLELRVLPRLLPATRKCYAINIYTYIHNNSVMPEWVRLLQIRECVSVVQLPRSEINPSQAQSIYVKATTEQQSIRQFLAFEGGTDDAKVPETVRARFYFQIFIL